MLIISHISQRDFQLAWTSICRWKLWCLDEKMRVLTCAHQNSVHCILVCWASCGGEIGISASTMTAFSLHDCWRAMKSSSRIGFRKKPVLFDCEGHWCRFFLPNSIVAALGKYFHITPHWLHLVCYVTTEQEKYTKQQNHPEWMLNEFEEVPMVLGWIFPLMCD